MTDKDAKRSPRRKQPPPPHLSEFYSFVDGSSPISPPADSNPQIVSTSSPTKGKLQTHLPLNLASSASSTLSQANSSYLQSQSQSQSQARSRTYSHSNVYPSRPHSIRSFQSSITPSTLDLDVLITPKDVDETVKSYKELVNTSESLRSSLVRMSEACSEFGQALERCARCKGSGNASDGIMAASGLQYLIGNQQRILASVLKNGFEDPVLKIIDEYLKENKDKELKFNKEFNLLVKELKANEKNNVKLSKKRTRNLISYKTNLLSLASQLDEIDRLKHDYYLGSFDLLQNASLKVLQNTKEIVQVETTIYDNIARKADAGGGLDDLLCGGIENLNFGNETILEADEDQESDDDSNHQEEENDEEEEDSTVNVEEEEEYEDEDDVVKEDKEYMQNAIKNLHSQVNHHSENDENKEVVKSGIDMSADKHIDQIKDKSINGVEDDTFYTPTIVKPDSFLNQKDKFNADDSKVETENILSELKADNHDVVV